MPRQRRKDSSSDETTNQNGGNTMAAVDTSFMQDVSDEELDAALAGSRARGVYDANILLFIDSGKRGVEINLAEGPHATKKAQSVKTGYESALERIKAGKVEGVSDEQKAEAERIKVVARNDRVFLGRQAVAEAA